MIGWPVSFWSRRLKLQTNKSEFEPRVRVAFLSPELVLGNPFFAVVKRGFAFDEG